MRKTLALILVAASLMAISGCAATLHGGAHQQAQAIAAQADAADTKAMMDAVVAMAGSDISAEGKMAALAMAAMAYQSKQHGNHFKPQLVHSPAEENWTQAAWAAVMAVFASKGGGGTNTSVEKSSSSIVEKNTTTITSVVPWAP